MRNLFLVLAGGALMQAAACGTQENTEGTNSPAVRGSINIDGSSTVFPITEAVAEEFRAVFPDIKVTVGFSGTVGGLQKFCRGEIDIAGASRPIKEKEISACAEAALKYLEIPVAFDGMAVLVNVSNDWIGHITVAELKRIWEPAAQGKIMRWNQVRPEWPDEELHLFGPGVASGTYDYFTEAVVGETGKSRGDFTASEDDNVLVQGIAGDKFSLGFFGLAYYEENSDKLKLVPVDNGTGPVTPTMETVKNGTYAPLARPLFIYVSYDAARRAEVSEFIRFYLENAPALAGEVGYVPLPDVDYSGSQEKYNRFSSELQ